MRSTEHSVGIIVGDRSDFLKDKDLREILNKVSSGELSVDEADKLLKMDMYEDLGFAKLDYQRELRQGYA